VAAGRRSRPLGLTGGLASAFDSGTNQALVLEAAKRHVDRGARDPAARPALDLVGDRQTVRGRTQVEDREQDRLLEFAGDFPRHGCEF
jgi:hypothetical protein